MSESPTFVVRFTDGETTRMTVFTSLNRLDVKRGKMLARYAYESRTGKQPPAFAEARFEQNGEVLKSYSAAGLETEE